MAKVPKTPKELELKRAIHEVFAEWISDSDMRPSVPITWVVIVEGASYDEDGEPVETTMIVPSGSTNQIYGLLANCHARLTAELIEGYMGRDD